MGDSRPRLAVFGVSHWHAPLYLEPLSADFAITIVTDPDAAVASQVASRTGARVIARPEDVGPGEIDVAVVLGRHDDMHRIAMHLVEVGVPFLVEKPAGLNLRELTRLRDAARERSVPVTVPLVHRWGPVAQALRAVEVPKYFSVTYLVGPPTRYPKSGNEWMLDIASAGGGPLVNVGVHFVDLFLDLAGEREATVRATAQRSLHHLDIEDHMTLLLETPGGVAGVIEVGYAFPDAPSKRFARFSMAGEDRFVSVGPDGRETTTSADGSIAEAWVDVDSDPLFGDFLTLFKRGLADGFRGLPTLDDLIASMSIIEAAYIDAGLSQGTGATWAS